jgi:transposase
MVCIIYTMSFIRKIKRGNAVYLAEVQNSWVDGKAVQKHLRYVGKEVDNKPFLSGSVERAAVDRVAIYGPLLVLDEIAKELGLSALLGDGGEYLLSLAYAHCVSPDSVNGLARWYQKTEIESLLHIPDVSYKKLLETIDAVDDVAGVQRRIFRRLKTVLNVSPSAYFYDLTNVYFYGLCCPLAKRGHNADGRTDPQIQIGLAVTQKDGLPIFHKVYEGHIFDARTLPDILREFERDEIGEVCLVWDRGVSSKLNIREARQQGYHVLCGLALKAGLKKEAERLLSDDLVSMRHRVRLKNATFYVKKKRYIADGVRGYLALCLNEKERQATHERRYDEIDNALRRLKERKPIKEGLRKYLHGRAINHRVLAEAERYDGLSVVFSTRALDEEEMVRGYFEKDRVEKSFRCMKSVLEMDKVRFWLANRVRGHIFVCYLAYLLLSVLEYKLNGTGVTASEALETMSSMYRVYLTDPKSKNKFVKTVTLSKAQEEILKKVNPRFLKNPGV